MDDATKKIALRMIPYGLYLLTAENANGDVAAATVNWVTQVSFEPPLVVVGVKVDSLAHSVIKETGVFALNMLGQGDQGNAFTFFKSHEAEGETIAGQSFTRGETGSPLFESAFAFIDCKLVDTVEKGDHSVFVGEVVDAGVPNPPEGRADEAILLLKDLGEKVFYGG